MSLITEIAACCCRIAVSREKRGECQMFGRMDWSVNPRVERYAGLRKFE